MEILSSLDTLSVLVGLLVSLGALVDLFKQLCSVISKKWKRPVIKLGLVDIPTSKQAEYYLDINTISEVTDITAFIKPLCGQPWDIRV